MRHSSSACRAQLLQVNTLPEQPWKNGGGSLREIACHPPGAGFADFDWRISLALVSGPGQFSLFPGVDRHIVLIEGKSMLLHDNEQNSTHTLLPLEPYTFAGEASMRSQPQGCVLDLNLMLRRGRAQGRLHAWHGSDKSSATLNSGFHVLYAAQGRYQLQLDGHDWRLSAGQALVAECSAPVRLRCLTDTTPAALVHAAIDAPS
ncbi:HutD/Ves family protein [Alcaligenes sp. SDU_A2]|uniref:HutD/Ves family protein n=1 Tax=Alcaligenes sp. SDU_A2 TaxID=3136634 RepID=UPI00311D8BAF